MADIELVIKIPEEVYKSIQDNDYCGISNSDMYNAIKNGTPLPKYHGRLIDADVLKTSFPCGDSVRIECVRATIDYAPTIIEAESEEEE